ncbi:MAG: diguanylate cyclase [Geodermatophilaceae bacterium]
MTARRDCVLPDIGVAHMDAARPPTARSLGDSPEEAFRRLFRDLACICGFDGTLHWVSPNWTEVLGHLPSDPLSRRYLTYIHPEDREATLTAIRGAASSLRLLDHLENRVVTPDGSYRWLQWSHEVDHEAETIYAVARDITERKHTELRLAASEARYRLLADHSTDAITVSSSEGAFTYVSPSGREIFGWEPEQLIGKDIYTFIHADDVEGLRASLSAMLSDPGVVTLVARFRRADDSYRWLESTGQQILDPDTGELTAVIGNTRDITERQRVQADLLRQAVTDPLTGVANRILLMDRMRGALLRLDRAPGLVAVVMLDLDRFKGVNDTLGHDAGDAVLIEAARRLQSVCRVSDSVARLGGDEFVVLAEGLSTVEDVDGLARRLGGVLREPFHVDRAGDGRAHSRVVTASIGIAMTGWHAHRPEDLMRGADLALYRAKSGGATGMNSSTQISRPAPFSGRAPNTCCGGHLQTNTCCCAFSRWSASPTRRSWGPRRSCGSSTDRELRCCPGSSSMWPSTRA